MKSWASLALFTFLIVSTESQLLAQDNFVLQVKATATSRQVAGYLDEKFLVSDEGLYEAEGDSGNRELRLRADSRMWNTAYGAIHGRNDESPIVEFEFTQPENVSGLMLWNMPGSRGFSIATLQFQTTDNSWSFLPEVLRFEAAPADQDPKPQTISFSSTIKTQRIRLWCHGTHRGTFGQPDVAGLGRVRFLKAETPSPSSTDRVDFFPVDSGIVDVTQPPYSAAGDGVTDDTLALQKAFDDFQASRRPIYFPPGTYLVSNSLRFKPGVFFGDNNVWGAGAEQTTIKLADRVFNDPENPQPVISFGFHGSEDGGLSADWFNNNIRGLTIDVGENLGAIGLQFYSNNAGAARDLVIRASQAAGVIGLDLGYKDQNGPLLVKDVVIEGFDVGVSAGNSVNSQTLSHLKLRDQRSAALRNSGQCLTVERFHAIGSSPSIQSEWGYLTLVDVELEATKSIDGPAVRSGEYLCVVNLSAKGFAHSIESTYPEAQLVADPQVKEFFSHTTVGDSSAQTELPARRETLEIADIDWSKAVNVRNFREITDLDDSAAFQRAIESGAETIYLPTHGGYGIAETVVIRGNVRHIVGFQAQLTTLADDNIAFVIDESFTGPLLIQDLIELGKVENRSGASISVRNVQGIDAILAGTGEVEFENVVGTLRVSSQQKVIARHFNSEPLGTKVINNGGELIIVGLKTERGGTLVETLSGGQSAIFGGLCYTTNEGGLAPMFVNDDSSVWASIGEVCYTGDPFRVLVLQKRETQETQWTRDQVPRRFEFLQGSAVLYDGRK